MQQIRTVYLIFIQVVLTLILVQCDKKHKDPVSVDLSLFPAQISHITASVGDGKIFLRWNSRTSNIEKYRVFRADALSPSFKCIDSTATTEYVDTNIQNGRDYSYKIAAVTNEGYQGQRSHTVTVAAGIYDILIANGEIMTNSQTVTLNITAPTDTKLMKVSNHPTLAGGSWESFTAKRIWKLTGGDGVKSVYVLFQDADNIKTEIPCCDSIFLDTHAIIYSLTENLSGSMPSKGDTIHFCMVTDDTGGVASVDIGTFHTGIALFNNGSSGDRIPNDNKYELDFIIPSGFEVLNADIIGHFTDAAGNIAVPLTSGTKLTVQNTPASVILYDPTKITHSSLKLHWSQNNDGDFASYRVFRSKTGIASETGDLIEVITDRLVNYTSDTDLEPGTTYYYNVCVYDTAGYRSPSNEISCTTAIEVPPTSVILYEPSEITLTSLKLFWTQNNDIDFATYRLFRSTTSNSGESGDLVEVITDRTANYTTDSGLKAGTTYYYVVYVFDSAGLRTPSNEVSCVTEIDLPPTAVTLFNPTEITYSSVKLHWSQNNDTDFASYRIFRSKTENAIDTGELVQVITDKTINYATDNGLGSITNYYYNVCVYDTLGIRTPSNEISCTTEVDLPPTAVVLAAPTQFSTTAFNLTWTMNHDSDFSSYRVYRSRQSPVDSTNLPIAILNNSTTTSFQDTGLAVEIIYYYRVFVYDQNGNASGSNEVGGQLHAGR